MTKQVKLDLKEVAVLVGQQLLEQGKLNNTKATAEWRIDDRGDLFAGLHLVITQEEEQV